MMTYLFRFEKSWGSWWRSRASRTATASASCRTPPAPPPTSNRRATGPSCRRLQMTTNDHISSFPWRDPNLPSRVAFIFCACIHCQLINMTLDAPKINGTFEGQIRSLQLRGRGLLEITHSCTFSTIEEGMKRNQYRFDELGILPSLPSSFRVQFRK